MNKAGSILMAIGALIVLIAFNMDTTVYSSGTLIGGDYVGDGSTHNLGLLQKQIMFLHLGLAIFLAGAFFSAPQAAAGERLRNSGRATEPESEEERELALEDRRRAFRAAGFVIGICVLLILILKMLPPL